MTYEFDFKEVYEGMDELTKSSYRYPYDVLCGNIITNKIVKKSCYNAFEDFTRQNTPNFTFYYEPETGERFRKFCLLLCHYKGPATGKPFVLDDWQVFHSSQFLGWHYAEGDNKGYRRIREIYLSVGRGNGKSFYMSALALWGLCCDGEGGPEVYSAATDRTQAEIVFGGTKTQITNPKHQKLMNYLGVRALDKKILCSKNNGIYRALSRDSQRMDGLNIHFAIVDELHAHPNRNTWDVLRSGAKKRKQSAMIAITTAGYDLTSFGFIKDEAIRMNIECHPDIRNPNIFGLIYGAEENDDPYVETTWKKANPCWDSAIDKVSFISDANDAKRIPTNRPEFFTKMLNIWFNNAEGWITSEDLSKCYDKDMFEGDKYECRISGFDLAYVNDLCCYVNVFTKTINNKRHYYIFPHAYVPSRAITNNVNLKYQEWVDEKQLKVIEGEAIDTDSFNQDLINNMKKYDIKAMAGDAWQATPTLQAIQKAGKKAVAVSQTTKALTQATSEFSVAVMEQRVHWNNKVFHWNCMNARLYIDANDLFKPVKEHKDSKKKIDTVAATINAIAYGIENNWAKSSIAIY